MIRRPTRSLPPVRATGRSSLRLRKYPVEPTFSETSENHEKIILKISKKFLTKIHYVGNVEFYRHANLQVATNL
jgi:hypothetical protein